MAKADIDTECAREASMGNTRCATGGAQCGEATMDGWASDGARDAGASEE